MTATAIDNRSASPQFAGPILELRGLEKRYTGTHALKPADLAFETGEIHAIVGENGAGKSTLIKALTAVHPRASGEALWRGGPAALVNPGTRLQNSASLVSAGTPLHTGRESAGPRRSQALEAAQAATPRRPPNGERRGIG